MVVLDFWSKWCILIQPSTCFKEMDLLILLKILFGASKYIIASYSMHKLLGVFLLQVLDSLQYLLLLLSPVHVKLSYLILVLSKQIT